MRPLLIVFLILIILGAVAGVVWQLNSDDSAPTSTSAPTSPSGSELRTVPMRGVSAPPANNGATPVAERYAKALAAVNLNELENDTRPAEGLRILSVVAGGQAARNGVKVDDRFSKVDGDEVLGLDAFTDAYDNGKPHTLTIWSPNGGTRELTDCKGRLGVMFIEDTLPELAYIRGSDRSAAWDKAVVVAATAARDDAELALHSIAQAQQAGYKGWLVAWVSGTANFHLSRHWDAMKHVAAIKSVPAAMRRPLLVSLFESAVATSALDTADMLESDYAEYHIKPVRWDIAPLYARFRALTPAEKALIGADGNLAAAIVQDHSRKLAYYDANAKIAGEYWKNHRYGEFGLFSAKDAWQTFSFGPFTQNGRVKLSFNFQEWKQHDPNPGGYFTFNLTDSLTSESDLLAGLTLYRSGEIELRAAGYAKVGFAKEIMRVNGNNSLQIVVNGPWFEITLNDQKLYRGLAGARARELYLHILGYGVQGMFSSIEYVEVDSKGWKPEVPIVTSAKTKELVVPPQPNDPELKWFHAAFVTEYLQHGKRNPIWDADAVEALALRARLEARNGAADGGIIYAACKRAVESGCDDPLVLKTYGDAIAMVERRDSAEGRRMIRRAADALAATKYSGLIQFMILRQCAELEFAAELEPLTERATARLTQAAGLIPLDDTGAPAWYLRDLLCEHIFHEVHGLDRMTQHKPLLTALERVPKLASIALTLKGNLLIKSAWDARGSGYANTVTQEGWKHFHERIDAANEALTKAWKLDSTNSNAMRHLITVAMAGRGELSAAEAFQNAVQADPNNRGAYHTFLYTLTPKWGGNAQALYAFGQACYTGVKSDPTADVEIAMLLLDAHYDLANDAARAAGEDQAERARLEAAYWEQPKVWNDVKLTFQLILARNPSSLVKSNYVLHATKCKQWKAAHALFEELGDKLAPGFFGGAGNAQEMKAKAALEARRTP